MPLESYTKSDGTITLTWVLDMEPGRVWEHLTDPKNLATWLGTHQFGDFRAGNKLVVDHGKGYLSESTILAVEPPHLLSMTWTFPDEPVSRLNIDVSSLEPAAPDGGGASTLRLEHRDLCELAESYLPGWVTHLSYFEASLLGHPLPAQSFWQLYASFDQLLS